MHHDVIVIGGGIAGLTAARDLVQGGHRVLVLEARDRLGGRTWWKRFGDTDHYTEMGGTWFDEGTQHNIAREIKRYSLPTVLSPAGQEFRVSLGGRSLARPDQPVPRDVRPDLDKALDHIVDQSRRVTFGSDLDSPDLHDLDIPFSEFIAPYTDQHLVAEYLSMWAAFAFGCDPSDVSALQVLTWVAGYDNTTWTLDDAPATKFAQGTESLVTALAEDGGADIGLSAPVASIADAGDHIAVTTTGGDTHRARFAVLATPVNTWEDIELPLPAGSPKRAFAAEGLAGHAVKLHALVDNVPEFLMASGWGGPLCWVSEQADFDGGRLLVGIGEDDSAIDGMDRAQVQQAIRQFAPEATVRKCHSHNWSTDPYAKGTWTTYRPGQLSRYYSDFSVPRGRLYFAGSDLARGWAGFMDGAIESGAETAATLSRRLREDG
ncbi:MAG: NAD(P)/FAD-dependent oxidoreductase [bacterium]|nr:NAD(P)/FAD-dependent oxidoreductase [bacterium]MDE0351933.1 NAD(P)/FAD-dependent oxidoreductase [bacterium]